MSRLGLYIAISSGVEIIGEVGMDCDLTINQKYLEYFVTVYFPVLVTFIFLPELHDMFG